jgi:hypothetical protein
MVAAQPDITQLYHEARSEIDRLRADVATRDNKIDHMHEELASARTRDVQNAQLRGDREVLLSQIRGEVNTLRAQLAAEITAREVQNAQLAAEITAREVQNAQVSTLQAGLKARNRDIGQKRKQLVQARVELAAIHAQLGAVQADLAASNARVGAVQADLAASNARVEERTAQIAIQAHNVAMHEHRWDQMVNLLNGVVGTMDQKLNELLVAHQELRQGIIEGLAAAGLLANPPRGKGHMLYMLRGQPLVGHDGNSTVEFVLMCGDPAYTDAKRAKMENDGFVVVKSKPAANGFDDRNHIKNDLKRTLSGTCQILVCSNDTDV